MFANGSNHGIRFPYIITIDNVTRWAELHETIAIGKNLKNLTKGCIFVFFSTSQEFGIYTDPIVTTN